MTKENTNTIQGNASFQRRLTAYSTLAVAGACAVAAAPKANADIIYSGPLNLSVTVSTIGSYFNLTTFAFGATYSAVNGGVTTAPAINLWGTGSTFAYLYPSASTVNRFVSLPTTSTVQNVPLGTPIGTTSSYGTTRAPGALVTTGGWVAGTTGYLGIQFSDPVKGTEYGWLQIAYSGTPTAATPTRILGAAFDNTGGTILAGQTAVPEPGTVGCLAAGAIGAASLAWRRRKAA